MKPDKQKRNWLIDAVLFGGFLVALWLDLTGVAIHQWLGLAVGLLAGYHLWKHWSWAKAVTARFLGRTSRQSRTYYVVDAGLAIGFAASSVTGLVISTWLDLPLASYTSWRDVHVVSSVLTLALVVAKIGLHWRWIISVARRIVASGPIRSGVAGQPAPAASLPGRRDFVRLMAGVAAMALLAGANVLAGSRKDQAVASSTGQAAERAQDLANTSSARTSDVCTVRCGKRCAYPGRCRKYTDSNGNGRCDLGECAT